MSKTLAVLENCGARTVAPALRAFGLSKCSYE